MKEHVDRKVTRKVESCDVKVCIIRCSFFLKVEFLTPDFSRETGNLFKLMLVARIALFNLLSCLLTLELLLSYGYIGSKGVWIHDIISI